VKKDKAINKALKNKFKPEFLNRIDAIINFKSLTKNDYMRIIDIELYKLNENLRNNDTEFKNLELKFDEKVKQYVYKNGIDSDFGARPLKRCIEKDIATPLANRLLEEESVDKDSVINVSFFRNKIKLDIEKRVDAPPFYVSKEYQEASVV
jgi:ATP-dependent Clp protease ATP-binding subunit ClpA